MKKIIIRTTLYMAGMFFSSYSLIAQNTNCFLEDFTPKNATIPISVIANKTTSVPSVTITLTADTLGTF